jgi:hypothetical protein
LRGGGVGRRACLGVRRSGGVGAVALEWRGHLGRAFGLFGLLAEWTFWRIWDSWRRPIGVAMFWWWWWYLTAEVYAKTCGDRRKGSSRSRECLDRVKLNLFPSFETPSSSTSLSRTQLYTEQ